MFVMNSVRMISVMGCWGFVSCCHMVKKINFVHSSMNKTWKVDDRSAVGVTSLDTLLHVAAVTQHHDTL